MTKSEPNSQRIQSYTGPRLDIVNCIPPDANYILDVGCSNGALGAALLAQNSNRHVIGIEYDQELYSEAKMRLTRAIHGNVMLLDWSQMFSAYRFDCIIFADVLEHLDDPWLILKKSIQFLSSGGVVVISLPNIRHISALNSIFFKGTFPKECRGIFDKTHLRWFTLSDSVSLCKSCGLNVKRVIPRLRIFDKPGGRLNQFVDERSETLGKIKVIREFLSYQYILVATTN